MDSINLEDDMAEWNIKRQKVDTKTRKTSNTGCKSGLHIKVESYLTCFYIARKYEGTPMNASGPFNWGTVDAEESGGDESKRL